MNQVARPIQCACLVMVAVTMMIVSSVSGGTDYEKVAQTATWSWSDAKAGLLYSFERDLVPYRLELVRQANESGVYALGFSKDGQSLLNLKVHRDTAFRCLNGIVYYAEHTGTRTGCTVVAFDLENRKELWRTKLRGLGSIGHEQYRNQVALDVNDEVVSIVGKETAGKYIEYLDRTTGTTVAHKVF